MRIGIICEGGNTDKPVLEKILDHKFPDHQFEVIGRSKEAIFLPCFTDINSLIEKEITKILILWDLLPVGKQMAIASQWSEKPSRSEQRKMLLQKFITCDELNIDAKNCCRNLSIGYGFEAGKITPTPVDIRLVCICYAMDGWLLSDENTLKRLASSNVRKVQRLDPRPSKPDLCTNPAGELMRIFKNSPNKRYQNYNKYMHNKDVINAYINGGRLDKMRTSLSYSRFIDVINEWVVS